MIGGGGARGGGGGGGAREVPDKGAAIVQTQARGVLGGGVARRRRRRWAEPATAAESSPPNDAARAPLRAQPARLHVVMTLGKMRVPRGHTARASGRLRAGLTGRCGDVDGRVCEAPNARWRPASRGRSGRCRCFWALTHVFGWNWRALWSRWLRGGVERAVTGSPRLLPRAALRLYDNMSAIRSSRRPRRRRRA